MIKTLAICSLILASGCSQTKKDEQPIPKTVPSAAESEAGVSVHLYLKNGCGNLTKELDFVSLKNTYKAASGEIVTADNGPVPISAITMNEEYKIGVYETKMYLIDSNTFQLQFVKDNSERTVISQTNSLVLSRRDFENELGNEFKAVNSFKVIFSASCTSGMTKPVLSRSPVQVISGEN